MIRAFLALPLPDEFMMTCLAAQGHTTTGRAVPSENLHITLLYLGEQPMRDLQGLVDDLDTIRHRPVPLRLTGIDVLGGWKGAQHLVASVASDPALIDIQAKVTRAARAAGLDFERRRFRPHVTLVRDFRGPGLPPWRGDTPDAVAGSFALYRSTLKRSGAEYDSLAEFPLTG